MSPLTKLSFRKYVVGDSGLKTGWVRCRNGAGRDGTGRDWTGRGRTGLDRAGIGGVGQLPTSLVDRWYSVTIACS